MFKEITSDKMRLAAPVVIRIGLSLVFLWFGSQQLLDAPAWSGLIPQSLVEISEISATTFVYLNGIFEIVTSLLLLIGLFTRISALLLVLHLFNIIFIVGYNDIGVRDFGLAMAGLSIFLYGADTWCLDKIFLKTQN